MAAVATSIDTPRNIRPSQVGQHDLNEFLRDVQNDMSTHQAGNPRYFVKETALKAVHATVKSQFAAIVNDHHVDIDQIKGDRYEHLYQNNFSRYNAYYIVYGKPVGRLYFAIRRCGDAINYVSQRTVEPPLRFIVVKVSDVVHKIVPAAPPPLPPRTAATMAVLQRALAPALTPRAAPAADAKVPDAGVPSARAAAAAFEGIAAANAAAAPATQASCCTRVVKSALSSCLRCWRVLPGHAYVEKVLVKKFIQDPIANIASMTTAGVVTYVSVALINAIGGSIVAVGQAGAALTVAAVSAAKDEVWKRVQGEA